MEKIKLAIIFGGKSSEYPVSLHSAGSLIHKINKEHYELIFIGISKDGKWYAYDGDVDGIEHDTWLCEEHCTPCVLSSSEGCRGFLKLHADGTFTRIEVDCIFPILHGKNGEDGTIQGLFELSGIPYVGCGHMSSAICMDKEMSHIVMEHAGIACAPFVCVYEADDLDYRKVYDHAKETLGLPIFIKPANAGSSFGIHRMESFEGFEEAMKDAFYHDGKGKVILETTIEGFEIGVAVMGNKELFAGSVDEIETAAPFFDYEGKYEMVDSHIYCPARISPKLFEEAREIAKKAYRAMNCKGMTRVDMFVTPEDTIILNEVNTIPGFTDTSRYPTMMKEAGIPFPELIDKLVALAMEE
ncbi:D-alanine--D-alanine ligase [[Clostridium] innocuum]|uniref:D-alanine--D-alanine ligase family protein n=1 Tax=Clostridium innocuum TaxID=1522 RepID=UPI002148498D|nr:D-alanine--D-alanine ligase family protein [[Clostridium] innocuum]MCR0274036.1 D-alanine--D-alanine ligase [[Clostridium] innocuum]